MKYRILIETQCIENYGAHVEPVSEHWKFKGGDRYIVLTDSDRVANAVAFLTKHLLSRGEGDCIRSKSFIEIPVSWQLLSEDDTHFANGCLKHDVSDANVLDVERIEFHRRRVKQGASTVEAIREWQQLQDLIAFNNETA